ncbi:hypothetical protein CRV03_09050 [Arcobacter sp. F155]|uniref:helix-turn-helix domain-containing protein n=1 Tax=Arcobacter sp. F155 TaxID=2044512 RepID=UPI00100B2374|nr:helix-turn-helix domain-containing protein [Arcobacter sp. F155]RXJ76590.1 hypothetical protein CRV03_09050 [Arcobacter sp. F155]
MSLKAMTIVFESVLPHAPKHILVAIADFADDSGYCFPSLRTLRYKTSFKKTTLVYHLRAIENIKLIQKVKRQANNGRNTSSAYIINLKNIEEKYTFRYKNLTQKEEKELELKIKEIEDLYQKKYQDVRNYKAEKSNRKNKKSQSEQYKKSKKRDVSSQREQAKKIVCVNNLNHQSNIDEEELNKNFENFYEYLNSIGVVATKSIHMHKNTIKVKLLEGDKFTIQNYKNFKTKSTAHNTA